MNEVIETRDAAGPAASREAVAGDAKPAIRTRDLDLWYGTFQALFDVDLDIADGIITALI